MKHRIEESKYINGVQRFYPQYKGWFFWHNYYYESDVNNDGLPCHIPDVIAFNTLQQAKEYLNQHVQHRVIYHEV